MSIATKQILDKLSALLKDARRLSPSDQKPDHAEAAPGASPKPNLAQAANADGAGEPRPRQPIIRRRRKAALHVSDSGAPAPH